jgi:hypothetical protein
LTVRIDSPEDLSDWIGEGPAWRLAKGRFLSMTGRFPAMAKALSRRWTELANMDEADFIRLGSVVAYLTENPHSGLYPRQLPISGVHTKWLEKSRQKLILGLMRSVLGTPRDVRGFHAVLGLKKPPGKLHLRILDPSLRDRVFGLETLTTTVEGLGGLPIQPSTVVIVENLQTGLAFGDLPGTVLFYGHGKNLAFLGDVPWLKGVRAFYWGDLDTHGLAMIGQARSHLPNLRSFLMDRETLLAHHEFWSQSDKVAAKAPDNLTAEETALFEELRDDVHGPRVRLEQEPISWALAWPVVRSLVEGEGKP